MLHDDESFIQNSANSIITPQAKGTSKECSENYNGDREAVGSEVNIE